MVPELEDADALAGELEIAASVAEAAHLRPTIELKHKLKPGVLETIRDMLLDGDDIDAIAILANELDLVPRPKRPCIWGFKSDTVAAHKSSLVRIPYKGRRWQPRALGVSRIVGETFRIHELFVLPFSAERAVPVVKDVLAEYFNTYRIPQFELVHNDKGHLVPLAVSGSGASIGHELTFPAWGGDVAGGILVSVLNLSDRPLPFEGFITGEYLDDEEASDG